MGTEFDFYSTGFQNDPAATYSAMRESCPYHHSEKWGWYSVFRFEDVDRIINDNVTYTARQGPGVMNSEASPIVLVSADPPEHTLQKRAVARVFNLRAMTAFEQPLRGFVNGLLDRVADQRRCDVIEDIGVQVPLWVVSELLGINFERHYRDLREWVVLMAASVFAQDKPQLLPAALAARQKMMAFVGELVDGVLRRRDAGDASATDVISQLAAVEIDGWRLTRSQLESFTQFLIVAGSATTTLSIGNFFQAMLDHPEQYAKLRNQPQLIENAVDEVIRFYAPVYGLFRTNNVPVQLGELTVPPASKICLMWGSANRDEALFANANELDITRDVEELRRKSLSFGGGIHRCMGAPLARLEVKVVAEEFLRRFPDFHEDGKRVAFPYATLHGPHHLFLAW
ncbi:MAG: cytochrome P450 [Pseudomonadales bacterium]|nr:cytochrome P450 [Pseudomonadales bacterium]MCP5184976.1 cytochrome P450 [Pseudomonadales bacterium]